VSRAALLEITKGVTHSIIKAKTILQISLSGARLITSLRSKTTGLTLKSSETANETNLKKSPRIIS
jgi:hypothetical protein